MLPMTRLRALYGHGVRDCLPVGQVVKEPFRTAGAYMMNRRGQREAASRFEERRSRENDAPRLRDRIPQLQSLRLELSEYRQGGTSPMGRHTRHIVVERAPALFIIPCGDHNCDDGGYNRT
ncbi:MAG: hypothetical protein DRI90_28735 [Deltaproteobacteria bacterium]|nr:MAG: hypothetical protein DRI90_28735 [Deltaproteobacteria bacterium]